MSDETGLDTDRAIAREVVGLWLRGLNADTQKTLTVEDVMTLEDTVVFLMRESPSSG